MTDPEVPDTPAAAGAVFGPALDRAERYAEILAGRGVEWGLIGPRERSRLWDRHLLNCAALAPLVSPARGTLADIGSGAGLPGVVLALLLPQVEVVLVEPMLRRATFLTDVAKELRLGNVMIRRARAEELSGRIGADWVTARAVAPLKRLAPLAAGLARRGGTVLAIKGSGAGQELEQSRPVLRGIAARSAEVLSCGHDRVGAAATVVRFTVG